MSNTGTWKWKLCKFEEICMEKLMKARLVNLFSAGFSHLEPLCKARLVPKPAKNEVWAITSGCCLLFHIDINGCLWGRGICHVYSANIARKNAMLPSQHCPTTMGQMPQRGLFTVFISNLASIQPHNSKKHQQIKNKLYFVC